MDQKKGFTLIELIMVMVILGIVAAIAIPKYVDLSGDAKDNALKGALGSIRAALSIQYANSALSGTASYPDALDGTLFAEGKVPLEPYFNLNSVSPSTENPIKTFQDKGGWIYNKVTGEVRADVAEKHAY